MKNELIYNNLILFSKLLTKYDGKVRDSIKVFNNNLDIVTISFEKLSSMKDELIGADKSHELYDCSTPLSDFLIHLNSRMTLERLHRIFSIFNRYNVDLFNYKVVFGFNKENVVEQDLYFVIYLLKELTKYDSPVTRGNFNYNEELDKIETLDSILERDLIELMINDDRPLPDAFIKNLFKLSLSIE